MSKMDNKQVEISFVLKHLKEKNMTKTLKLLNGVFETTEIEDWTITDLLKLYFKDNQSKWRNDDELKESFKAFLENQDEEKVNGLVLQYLRRIGETEVALELEKRIKWIPVTAKLEEIVIKNNSKKTPSKKAKNPSKNAQSQGMKKKRSAATEEVPNKKVKTSKTDEENKKNENRKMFNMKETVEIVKLIIKEKGTKGVETLENLGIGDFAFMETMLKRTKMSIFKRWKTRVLPVILGFANGFGNHDFERDVLNHLIEMKINNTEEIDYKQLKANSFPTETVESLRAIVERAKRRKVNSEPNDHLFQELEKSLKYFNTKNKVTEIKKKMLENEQIILTFKSA